MRQESFGYAAPRPACHEGPSSDPHFPTVQRAQAPAGNQVVKQAGQVLPTRHVRRGQLPAHFQLVSRFHGVGVKMAPHRGVSRSQRHNKHILSLLPIYRLAFILEES
jgi:hypothetical protein